MKDKNKIGNIELHPDCALVSINPKIYGLDIIYAAAYTLLDQAYVFLDGDPKTEVQVHIRPKSSENLEELGNKLNDELLNYAVYKSQSEKNSGIRQAIIQRALLTNGFDIEDEMDDDLDDPEGIAIPWEEKYSSER